MADGEAPIVLIRPHTISIAPQRIIGEDGVTDVAQVVVELDSGSLLMYIDTDAARALAEQLVYAAEYRVETEH